MTAGTPPDWPAIEQDYRKGKLTIARICKKHGISRSALAKAKNRYGWPGRYTRPLVQRDQLIERLFGVLEKQIKSMEIRDMNAANPDKEVALLGTLSRTLEKLVELDVKQGATSPKPKRPRSEMMALREKISARISQLEKT